MLPEEGDWELAEHNRLARFGVVHYPQI